MKLIINSSYGGFQLSKEFYDYYNIPYKEIYGTYYAAEKWTDDVRKDLRLIDYIEKFGSKAASGRYSCLTKDMPIRKMFMYVGKTLAEVAEETRPNLSGYCVMILKDEEDSTGEHLDESYSVRAIIEEHPEIANYRVKFENDFFGELVLRVIKENEYEIYS